MAPTSRQPERALRALLVANDGMSAGHVARAMAIGRALRRRAHERGFEVRIVFATTSTADALLADEPFVFVRLPPPGISRAAGFEDAERRRLVSGVIESIVASFRPDVVISDTFPSGPHGELARIDFGRAKRVLVRRAVPEERTSHETLTMGLGSIDFAIVADDPTPFDVALPVATVRVPPITLGHTPRHSRDDARAKLGLARTGAVYLVAAGGGGDADAVDRSVHIASALARLAPEASVVRAAGPLEPSNEPTSMRTIRVAPLEPWLSAFDGAFAAAGYNTAHELAAAGVPAALYACARAFDDQAARARRFASAGLAHPLDGIDDEALRDALTWLQTARPPRLDVTGADRAADAILERMGAPPTDRH